jgi:hypothetical protein
MKVSQKLQVARNLVAQGWMAGGLVSLGIDGRYKYCARGALNKAFFGRATTDAEFRPDDELRLAQRLVAEAMHGRFFVESDPTAVRVAIGTWNDSQLGTPHAHARVVAAFDAAVAECKRLEDDAEKALAEGFTMLPVTQGESHPRRDPTLTTTGAPTSAYHTHRSHGRHRAHRLDRPRDYCLGCQYQSGQRTTITQLDGGPERGRGPTPPTSPASGHAAAYAEWASSFGSASTR